MSDIVITWDSIALNGRFSIADGDIARDQDLRTSVLISLFTWRRADPGDIEEGEEPNGYWGDSFADPAADRFGSKLWLLLREKLNDRTIQRATDYAREALQWLLDDRVARRIDVLTERGGNDRLNMAIDIYKQDGELVRVQFDDFWDAVSG